MLLRKDSRPDESRVEIRRVKKRVTNEERLSLRPRKKVGGGGGRLRVARSGVR